MKTRHILSIVCVLFAAILFLYANQIRTSPESDQGILVYVTSMIDRLRGKSTNSQTTQTPQATIDIDSMSEEDLSEYIFSFVEEATDQINKERASIGTKELTLDENVIFAAMARSEEIKTTLNHTRPDGTDYTTVLSDNKISYTKSGEIMSIGAPTPDEAVSGWINSTEDQNQLMNQDYSRIGIGLYITNDSYKYYWVVILLD